ncbi:MAG: TetR/AcrR family transcriptional regulator [Sulfurimonas sp.]
MAIIVNKEEKRRNIALSCRELLLKYGIENITISQIAKTAGVGKGTIYEYFNNKEEIVFEIMTVFIAEYEKDLSRIVSKELNVKKKLFHFLYLSFEDEDRTRQLALYREFLAITMRTGTDEMIEFNKECRKKFIAILNHIIDDGIKKGELPSEVKGLTSMIVVFALGLIVEVHTARLNPKEEIEYFLDTLFELIKE